MILQPTDSMWTPRFPRIAGADTSRNGLSLYALVVAHVVFHVDAEVSAHRRR